MPTASDAYDGLIKNRRRPGHSRANDPSNTSGENDPDQAEPESEPEPSRRRASDDEGVEGAAHYSEEDSSNIKKRAKERYGY